MFQHISLKMKLILSSIGLVVISGVVIGGLSLQQFISFSQDAMSDTRTGFTEQGLLAMQTGVESDQQRVASLIGTAHDTAARLAASSNMLEYLKAEQNAKQTAQREADRIAEGLLDTCRIQHNLLQRKVDDSLNVAEYVMAQYGTLAPSVQPVVRWEATNQITKETVAVWLPAFIIGATPLSENASFDYPTPLVDEVQQMMNTTCTVFQRMTDQGDMLRIATTVKTVDGQRAVGTYIPAVQPDGTPNPVVTALLKSETYRGRAYVVNAWYITAYKPILDAGGTVKGALYVGVPQESAALTQTILHTKVGQLGYSFVIDSTGKTLIHPQTDLIGKNVIQDLHIEEFREILAHKQANTPQTIEYMFDGRKKLMSYLYFPEWDWILCVSYYWEDIAQEAIQRARQVLENEIATLYQTSTVRIDRQDHPMFNQIRYIDERGQEVIVLKDGNFTATLTSKAETSWFQNSLTLKKGEVYDSDVEIAANTGNVELRALSPTFVDEQFKGIVVVNLDWKLAWGLLKEHVYGNTGYAYIINHEGVLISHPKYMLPDQVNITDAQYGELANLVRDKMLPGETGVGRYTFEGVEKFVAFAPLQVGEKTYVLAVTTPVEEFFTFANSITQRTDQKFRRTIAIIAGVFGISVISAFALAIVLSRSITKPVVRVVEFARNVSAGDLSVTLPVINRDEIGVILTAINTIVQSLKQFIAQIQRVTIQVTSSATELSATAQQHKVIIATQVESTEKVGASVREISDVSAHLGDTMQQVATMSQQTAEFASRGQMDLTRMEEAINRMELASKSISGRLEAIHQKANNITNVVTTINKVADQTNLLSLNASIEAEKAGEYGRGFIVVAREIRRLADQTALATLDIDQMVHEMQSAVSSGVMEMDKFIVEVRQSAEDIEKMSAQLSRIIEQVQTLSPRFEEVNAAMGQQSEQAQAISQTMLKLNEEMQQTSDSLKESFLAIEQLNEATQGLQHEVSRFKVS